MTLGAFIDIVSGGQWEKVMIDILRIPGVRIILMAGAAVC